MKASLIKTMALASGFASLAAFSVVPAMAADSSNAQSSTQTAPKGKTRAEVRAEYLQAVREGSLPNTSELDESSYRAVTLTRSPASTLTREAVQADTMDSLQMQRGDVGMGSK